MTMMIQKTRTILIEGQWEMEWEDGRAWRVWEREIIGRGECLSVRHGSE